MRKVGLYLRVSTEEQAKIHEGSLISQRQRLEDYIKGRNMIEASWGKVAGVFVDEARSGKDTNRPEFKRMLREIEVKNVDTILVTELSRLSRNMKDFCGFWDFLKSNKAQFLSLREQFDTTSAAGEMMIFSIINFAQFERKQTSERVSANFQARAQRGLFNGGYPPLGFDTHHEKKGLLVVNEKEAFQVRRIFQIFLEEGRLVPTLLCMQEEGIKTKKRTCKNGKTVGNKEWVGTSLYKLLTNRHYIGEREINKKARGKNGNGTKAYQTTQAQWSPIVSKSVFDRAQELLRENAIRYNPETRDPFDYVLTSTVNCPDCKRSMIGYSGRGKYGEKYVYYSHQEKSEHCKIQRISAKKLHDTILNRLKDLVKSPALVERLYERFQEENQFRIPENERRLGAVKQELSTLNSRSQNLLDQLQTLPRGSGELILLRLQDLEKQIIDLQQEERRLSEDLAAAKKDASKPDELDGILQGWSQFYPYMTLSERREFIRHFIDRIQVFPKQVHVRYNCDMKSVSSAMGLFRSMANRFSKKEGQVFENAFFTSRSLGGMSPPEPFSSQPNPRHVTDIIGTAWYTQSEMEKDYWNHKWKMGDIRFHRNSPHPILVKYFVSIMPGKVFVPFCGKSEDLHWLTEQRWKVVGSELNDGACESYFAEHEIKFSKERVGDFTKYATDYLEIWCGDHFKLPKKIFSGITAWYDRGALVALPKEMRKNYIEFFSSAYPKFNTEVFQMLLISMEYNRQEIQGPPFNVAESEIRDGLEQILDIELIEKVHDPLMDQHPKFQGVEVLESVYLLKSKKHGTK